MVAVEELVGEQYRQDGSSVALSPGTRGGDVYARDGHFNAGPADAWNVAY